MNNIFKDEVIYITGASAGIGFATAKVCMKRGATVVITGRNAENLKQAELELQKISPNVIAHNLDVSDESAISDSLNEIYKICGKVDGLVNNAPSIHTGKIVDLSLSAWKTNFKANLDAVFLTTKTVLPWMMAVKKGSIVNIASVVGLKGVAYMSAYGAAKAGLINFSRAAAVEAAPHIRVNCLIPGAVLTPATERAIPDEDMMSATISSIPLKRIAEPMELAKPIAFLLSSDASFITGSSLVVDGGKTADLNAGN